MEISSVSRRGRGLRAALCAGGSVLALALTGAQAADTTWTGATPDFTLNTNWSTAAPTTSDNAIFGSTGATTISLASATDARAQSFTFNAGAPQYTFSIGSGSASPSILTFTGAGIINNSGNAPIFNLVDAGFGYTQLNFGDFFGTGSATTTAGNAIINSDSAVIQFSEHATAGTAIITQTGSSGLNFRQNSSADHATISGFIQFQDNSTADHAAISDINYQLKLSDNATLGNATVTTSAGTIYFSDSSTGGSAAVALSGSASINLQSLTASGITLGSLSGTGGSDIVALGSKNLTLGSLGGNQAFDGAITGTGGSLTKTGTGTLTLSGAQSNYTGGTTVTGGLINFDAGDSLGSGNVTLNGGGLQWATGNTLDISSRLAALGASGGTFDTNGNNVTLASAISGGALTKAGTGTLTLSGANTYTGGTTVTGGLINFISGGLGSSGTITLNGGGLQWASGNTQDISSRLALTGAAILDTNGNDVSFGTALAGNALQKLGAGTLALNAASSFISTTVTGGLVNFANAINLGNITLNGGGLQWATGNTADISSGLAALGASGGVFDTNGNNVTLGTAITGAGALTKTGEGTLTLNGINTHTGATIITGGTLLLGDTGQLRQTSTITVGDGTSAAKLMGSGLITYAPIVDVKSGATLQGGNGGTSGNQSLQMASSAVHIESGATIASNTDNSTYTDQLYVGSLTLDAGSILALNGGGHPGNITTAQLLILVVQNNLATTFGTVTGLRSFGPGIAGKVLYTPSEIRLGFDNLTFNWTGGTSDFNTGGNWDGNYNPLTAETGIFGTTGSSTVNVNATTTAGGLTFNSGANAYAINVGTSGAATTFTLDTAGIVNNSSNTQAFTVTGNTGSNYVATLAFTGAAAGDSRSTVALANAKSTLDISGTTTGITLGAVTGSGTVALGAKALTIANTTTDSFSGVISGSGGSLTKTGVGTLVLGGVNTYTGATTVSAGTLQVTGTVQSSVSVTSGGALAGTGTVGGPTIFTGGILAPGVAGVSGGIGTLNLAAGNNLNLTSGSIFDVDIAAGTNNSDRVALSNGAATLTGSTLQLEVAAGAYTAGTTYNLITGLSADPGAYFGSITVNSGTLGSLAASASYSGGSIVLTLNNPTFNWTGATADFNTASNWGSGSVPGTGNAGVFAATGSTTVNVNATTTAGGLTFNAGANAYTVNVGTSGAATTFTLDTTGIVNNSSNTQAFTVTGDTGSNYVATLAFTGAAAGDSKSTVDLANAKSTLDISGTTSGITLGAVTGSGTVALGAKALTIANTTADSFSGVIGGTGTLTKSGAGTLVLGGVNTYTGGTTVSGGLINFISGGLGTTGTITLNGGGLQWATGNTQDISSRLAALGAGGGTLDTNGNNVTLATAMSGTGALTKTGAGTLTLNAFNPYSGATTITGGTLLLGATGRLENTSTITVGDGTSAAKLMGTGLVLAPAPIDVKSGATLQGGNGGTSGNQTLQIYNSTVHIESGATIALNMGNAYVDQLSVGTLTLDAGSILALNGGGINFGVGGSALLISVNHNDLATTFGTVTGLRSFGPGVVGHVLYTPGEIRLGFDALTFNWTAGTSDFNTGGNWSGNYNPLTADTAIFGAAGSSTVTIGTTTTVGGMQFNAGAQSYSLNVTASGSANALTLAGTGIVNNSGQTQTFNVTGDTGGGGFAATLGFTGAASGDTKTGVNLVNGQSNLDISGSNSGITIKDLGGAGVVTLGGKILTIANGGSTFSGAIHGTGGLVVGGGTVALTGNNDYSGGTTVSGTLRLGSSTAAGTGTITTTGSVIDYADGDVIANPININSTTTQLQVTTGSATQQGVISETAGPRPVEKTGAGTLILTGTETYTGVTTITAGTLQVGSGAAAGALGSGNVTDNGALVFNRSDGITFAGAITGSGSVAQQGSGTLTLTGTSGYTGGTTVSNGTLALGTLGNTAKIVGMIAVPGGTLSINYADLTGVTAVTNTEGTILFNNASNAGGMTITTSGPGDPGGFITTRFSNTSSAGTATINTGTDGGVFVQDTATLGTAHVTNAGTLSNTTIIMGAALVLRSSAALTTPVIVNNTAGFTYAQNNSDLGQASITNNANGLLIFEKGSSVGINAPTANSATIVNNNGGVTSFSLPTGNNGLAFGQRISAANINVSSDAGTAANATITNNSGGATYFFSGTSGGSATLINNAGGTLDISGLSISGTTLGSLSGAGNVFLGSKSLTLTGNADAAIAGVIADGGTASGTGGSLVKQGTGTLVLTGANTYTGTTTVNAGTLQIGIGDGDPAPALGTGAVTLANGATLFLNVGAGLNVNSAISGGGTLIAGGVDVTLTANNSYGATIINSGTTLRVGQNSSGSLGTGNVTDNGELYIGRSDTVTLSQVISGSGNFRAVAGGTIVFTAANSYAGFTDIVNGSTLSLSGSGSIANTSGVRVNQVGDVFDITAITPPSASIGWLMGSGAVNLGGKTLVITAGFGEFDGTINGSGGLTLAGGTTTLGSNVTFAGTTTIASGASLQFGLRNKVGAGSAAGSLTGPIVNNGTLVIFRSNTFTLSSTVTGSGAIIVGGGGTAILANAYAFDGATIIPGSTLQLGNGGTAGSIGSGAITDNGTLSFNRTDTLTMANAISGTGTLTKSGSGTLVLSGGSNYSGGTTIAAGTLGLASNTGAGTGAITTTGSVIDYADGVSIANPININSNTTQLQVTTGSATQSGVISETGGSRPLEKIGAGTLVLSGNNTYSGTTTVSGGTLSVTGSIGSPLGVTVQNTATLTGTGAVGPTTVQSGGVLLPGVGGIGTLTVNGNLNLQAGSQTAFFLNQTDNSRLVITGAASLGGTAFALFAVGGAAYAPKQYTLLTATGGLGGSTFVGLNTLGSPAGLVTGLSYDATHVYLNLSSSSFIWNATPATSDWNTAANWQSGAVPSVTDTAIFAATNNATVTVSQATNVKSLQFNSGAPAYTLAITGAASVASLTLATGGIVDNSSNAPTIIVSGADFAHGGSLIFNGSGTAADTKITAGAFGTVAFNALTDAGAATQLTAQGGGTIDFSGSTGLLGDNKINAGSIAGAGSLKLGANILTVGALSTSTEFSGVISGTGALTKTGTGTLTLSATNTYSGTTTISGGTLQIGNGGTNGSVAGNITDNGALVFNRSNTQTFSGVISGTGSLTQAGTGTITLSGTNTYTGTTTIASGATLEIGNNTATGSLGSGAVTDNGQLVFLRTTAITVANVISGAGTLEQSGSGTLTLTAISTYSGATNVDFGTTLALSGAASIAGSQAVVDQGTFDISQTTSGASIKGVNGVSGGIVALGSKTLTLTGSGALNLAVIQDGGIGGGSGGSLAVTGGFHTLTGTNTYTGTTTIASGATLKIGNNTATGSLGSGAVTDNGALTFSRTNAITVANTISGSGTLSQLGSGVLTLTGVNSFTGLLLINPGTVALSGNGSVAAASGVRTFGNFDISGTTSGTSIRSLDLIPVVGQAFTGQVFLGSKTLTISSANTEFDGVLQDGGIVAGANGGVTLLAGTQTFGGINAYTGVTTITGGTLALTGAGSIAASSRVSDNGVFNISGTTSGAAIKALTGTGSVVLGARTLTLRGGTAVNSFGGVISGTGSLAVATGSSILTGANTYTGGTTLGANTSLGIGNDGTTGSIVGNVANAGILYFRRSDALTFAGVVSGTGKLDQDGAGILTLTGVNTFTGAVDIGPGTLALSGAGSIATASTVWALGSFDISGTNAGASVGSLGLDLASTDPSIFTITGAVFLGGKTLTITNASTEFDGVLQDGGIAGGTGGSVVITGGTEIFGGANTYTGGTTIASGATLQLGIGGTSGGLAGNIVDNGSLIVNRSDSINVTNVVSGSGSVTKLGANTMSLLGTNTYTGGTTITAGTLQIGNGGTIGAIAGNVTDNATLAFNRSDDVTFAGVITGAGALVQAGGGRLTLSGASTYSGATMVSGGTLSVNGSIAASSGVTVSSGATLGGTGTVASTTITSGGTLAPGNSIGTLNVSGKLTLAPGSGYSVELSPATSDLTLVSGTASIAGTLSAGFAAGAYAPGQVYTLLASTGLLSGTFDNLVVNNAPANYLTLLSYDAHDVFLTLTPKDYIWAAAPVSSDWNTGANWKYGLVPGAGDVAQFDTTSGATVVDSASASAKSLQFNTGAPAYSLAVTGSANGAASLTVSQGITDASANAPAITVSGASATNTGKLAFTGTGNAADAAITAGAFGIVSFAGTTDASAAAKLTANAGGAIDFSATTGANGDNKIAAGSIAGAGAGSIVLGANTLTTGALGTSTEFAGVISGTGALVKTGTGTLILSGANTYTGGTTVNAGVLSVNGSVAGAVSVAGGTLKGSGRIGTVTVANGAAVAPGNSIGTLSVGTISFAANSTYQAEVNAAGQSDLINASGTATLNGSVQAVEAAGTYAPVTTYRIINATGVSGTFSNVTSSLSNLTPTLVYGAGSVDLKLVRNDLAFGASGNTFNQIAAGSAVSAGGISTGLYNAVATVANNASAVPAALDSLSGEIHASLRSAMLEDSHVIRDTLMDRLSMPASGTTIWAQGFANSGYLDSDGNAARASRNMAGAAGGIDTVLDKLRLGFGGSLDGRKLSVAARGSSASGSGGTLFGYAGWKSGPLAVNLGGDLGWGDMHIVRAVSALSETESSNRHGTIGEVFAQASYDIDLATALVSPYVALDHVSASTDAFSEAGGIGALSGSNATLERTYALMGARGTLGQFDLGGMPLTPRAGLSWSHAFGGAAPAEALAFRSTGQSFTVLGTSAANDAALVSLALDLNIAPQMPVMLGYDGSFSGRGQSHTVHGGVGWKF